MTAIRYKAYSDDMIENIKIIGVIAGLILGPAGVFYTLQGDVREQSVTIDTQTASIVELKKKANVVPDLKTRIAVLEGQYANQTKYIAEKAGVQAFNASARRQEEMLATLVKQGEQINRNTTAVATNKQQMDGQQELLQKILDILVTISGSRS